MERVLIVGATSGIARALAAELAARGTRLALAARDLAGARSLAAELAARTGADVPVTAWDALAPGGTVDKVRDWVESQGVTGVVVAVGCLPDQAECQRDPESLRRAVAVNFTEVAALLELFAGAFVERGGGFLCALSSVAGDRGRASNYVYGAAKAGLTAYLSGLRNRLAGRGVRVLTVKPGFVRTRMVRALPPSRLTAEPGRVARDIADAIHRGRDVLYTPWFWRYIMLAVRGLPEAAFKRTRL